MGQASEQGLELCPGESSAVRVSCLIAVDTPPRLLLLPELITHLHTPATSLSFLKHCSHHLKYPILPETYMPRPIPSQRYRLNAASSRKPLLIALSRVAALEILSLRFPCLFLAECVHRPPRPKPLSLSPSWDFAALGTYLVGL